MTTEGPRHGPGPPPAGMKQNPQGLVVGTGDLQGEGHIPILAATRRGPRTVSWKAAGEPRQGQSPPGASVGGSYAGHARERAATRGEKPALDSTGHPTCPRLLTPVRLR